jgi:hypothetical protein
VRVDMIVAPVENSLEAIGPTVELPLAEVSGAIGQVGQAVEQVETVIAMTADSQGPVHGGEREAIVDDLDRASQRIKEAVQDVGIMIVAAQAPIAIKPRRYP